MLAHTPINYAQRYPFCFKSRTFDDFLHHSGLRDGNSDKIVRFAYPISGFSCFSDLRGVRDVLTADEFEEFVEALYQTRAFSLRLRVRPDSDLNALVAYWGKGGREKLIRPLLKALTKVTGGAAINVSFLLPPFARNRLYTYPASWNDPAIEREDCFFTAINFFNDAPDTNLFDHTYAKTILYNEFLPASGQPTYGDLVAVSGPSGAVVHVCVYIAKDFVFTKNGLDRPQPWVLMRMTDMLRCYYVPAMPGRVTFFRRAVPT